MPSCNAWPTDTPTALTQALGHKETQKYSLEFLAVFSWKFLLLKQRGKPNTEKNELLSSSFGLQMLKFCLYPWRVWGCSSQPWIAAGTVGQTLMDPDHPVLSRMDVWGRRCTIKQHLLWLIMRKCSKSAEKLLFSEKTVLTIFFAYHLLKSQENEQSICKRDELLLDLLMAFALGRISRDSLMVLLLCWPCNQLF